MRVYKLTDSNWKTYNKTKWGPGVTHETSGWGSLCGPGWLHAYSSPELAVFLNPIHADFDSPVLWEADAEGKFLFDRGLKLGCTQLTTLRIIEPPSPTTLQRVAFGIFCALQTACGSSFRTWADAWLSGADRSEQSAREVALLADEEYSVAAAAAEAAARAAWAAAEAAAAWAAAEAAAAAAARATSTISDFSFLQRCATQALEFKA